MSDKNNIKDLARKVYELHVKLAPAIPVAVAMVLLAKEKLGKVKKKMAAICETRACLPDAIQVLTDCTVGNGYLKILDDIGRFALTFFDRADGRGIRVHIDLNKITEEKMPETYKFFRRKRHPEVNDNMEIRRASNKKVIDEFYKFDPYEILSYEEVKVKEIEKPVIAPVYICEKCKESFHSLKNKKLCSVCDKTNEYYIKK